MGFGYTCGFWHVQLGPWVWTTETPPPPDVVVPDSPPAAEGDAYRISVTLRGWDADYWEPLAPVEVQAWNLHDALMAAAALPLANWFPPDTT